MDPLYLFLAIVWSAAGLGFFVYGRKRRRAVPLSGGIILMGISYVAKTPLTLCLTGALIVAMIFILSKRF